MPNKEKIDWEAAYTMQDKGTMFLLYAVSEGLCRHIDDFSTHFDFEGPIEAEIQTLVTAGFLEESEGYLSVTKRGRFVLVDLANFSKSARPAVSRTLNVNDLVIKLPLQERLKDSAFDELWCFDPAQKAESLVFNREGQLEDMQTPFLSADRELLPRQFSVESKEISSSIGKDIEPFQLPISVERLISASVQRELERRLPLQRQAHRRLDGGSMRNFGLKSVV